MEKLKQLRKFGYAGIGAGILALTGCADTHNYAGEGNAFTIRGPVQDIGDNSVEILPSQVLEAQGKAASWFDPTDQTRVHDNYENSSCDQVEVGDIRDTDGYELGLDDLSEGQWVEISGAICHNKDACGKYPSWSWRPVFELVVELDG